SKVLAPTAEAGEGEILQPGRPSGYGGGSRRQSSTDTAGANGFGIEKKVSVDINRVQSSSSGPKAQRRVSIMRPVSQSDSVINSAVNDRLASLRRASVNARPISQGNNVPLGPLTSISLAAAAAAAAAE